MYASWNVENSKQTILLYLWSAFVLLLVYFLGWGGMYRNDQGLLLFLCIGIIPGENQWNIYVAWVQIQVTAFKAGNLRTILCPVLEKQSFWK